MHGSFCALIKYIYLCFKEIIFYFCNYEGFGECTDEAWNQWSTTGLSKAVVCTVLSMEKCI